MRALRALSLLIPALFLAACGDKLPAAGSRPTVGFSQIGAESAWRVAETESIRAEAEKRGIPLKLADAQGKQESQIQALHSFIAQKVGAVILAPQKKSGFEPALRELKAAGIPVVLVDRGLDCDPTLYATLIASDFVAEGRMAAEWLISHTEGEVRVAEIEGTAGSDPAIDRKKGFDERIAAESRIHIVKSLNGQFELPKGKEVMEAILKAEQNKIDAVYAHNDDMALGAIQALEAAGLQPGKNVLVISVDATRAAFDAIVEGKLSCAVECSPLLGPLAFDALERIAKGETVEKRIVVADRIFDAGNAAAERPNRKY
ncbi:MAG TPA: ABC transporter substrate-binding protein [Planctomycetota bacterium]|nr:ABC transporter substrate-binding protein [Planctomycetota bacterium]